MKMADGKVKTHRAEDTTADWDDALLFEVAVDPFQKIATSAREEGRTAGLRNGYLEGVNIGRSKGWEIGLELGYFHDFAQGILDECTKNLIHDQQQKSEKPHNPEHRASHRFERCMTLSRDLVQMINGFPDPDLLLSQNEGDREVSTANESTKNDNLGAASDGDCCNNDDNHCSEKSSHNSCCKSNSNVESTDCQATDEGNTPGTLNFRNDKELMGSNPAAMLDISSSIERIRAKFKLLCVLLKTKQPFDLKKVLELGDGSGVDNRGQGDMTENEQSIDGSLKNTGQRARTRETNPGSLGIESASGKQDPNTLQSEW